MEKMRRFANGRLSEIFGENSLETDKFMRILGCRRSAEQAYELTDDILKKDLRAYADGINDFVLHVDHAIWKENNSAQLLPPEFFMFGIDKYNYSPWTPLDSLSITYMQSHLL